MRYLGFQGSLRGIALRGSRCVWLPTAKRAQDRGSIIIDAVAHVSSTSSVVVQILEGLEILGNRRLDYT